MCGCDGQVSRFTGALLNLLGVPMNALILEESASANHLVQHWVPQWNPLKGPNIRSRSDVQMRLFRAPPCGEISITALCRIDAYRFQDRCDGDKQHSILTRHASSS